jgi:hypothetical protein
MGGLLGALFGGGGSSSTVQPQSEGLNYSGNLGGTSGFEQLTFGGQVKNSSITVSDQAALAEVNNLANLIAGQDATLAKIAEIAIYAALGYAAFRAYKWVAA